jgi:hypothetical protein
MKAKLIRDGRVAPSAPDDERIEVRDGVRYWPAGTVHDHPRAYRLVEMGMAEPADDECRLRACMTTEEMKAAQVKQELVGKGIHPDDYQRYLDGEIIGYDEDGADIPGPNWVEDTDENDD